MPGEGQGLAGQPCQKCGKTGKNWAGLAKLSKENQNIFQLAHLIKVWLLAEGRGQAGN